MFLDAHGTLEGPTLPITILVQSWDSSLSCPIPIFWPFRHFVEHRLQPKLPFPYKGLEFVRHERHKRVGCDRTVSRNNDSKLLLVISALSNICASS